MLRFPLCSTHRTTIPGSVQPESGCLRVPGQILPEGYTCFPSLCRFPDPMACRTHPGSGGEASSVRFPGTDGETSAPVPERNSAEMGQGGKSFGISVAPVCWQIRCDRNCGTMSLWWPARSVRSWSGHPRGIAAISDATLFEKALGTVSAWTLLHMNGLPRGAVKSRTAGRTRMYIGRCVNRSFGIVAVYAEHRFRA